MRPASAAKAREQDRAIAPGAPMWTQIASNDERRCVELGMHDFVMAGIEPGDPSVDECTRCKIRRY